MLVNAVVQFGGNVVQQIIDFPGVESINKIWRVLEYNKFVSVKQYTPKVSSITKQVMRNNKQLYIEPIGEQSPLMNTNMITMIIPFLESEMPIIFDGVEEKTDNVIAFPLKKKDE